MLQPVQLHLTIIGDNYIYVINYIVQYIEKASDENCKINLTKYCKYYCQNLKRIL